MVVFRLEDNRVHRHLILHLAEEEQSSIVPARLPSCDHGTNMVDWCEMGGRRTM